MVIIGLVLIALGGARDPVRLSSFSEPGHRRRPPRRRRQRLTESFFVGVAAGAAILWGFSILKWGTKRSLAHRRERKELTELNQKLERVEAERRADGDTVTDRDRT